MTATIPRSATFIGWGYEGRTVADLVLDAVGWEIPVVADVRLNAVSRRPGFSKRALATALGEAGIEYVHLRDLGNPRDNRPGFAETSGEAAAAARQRYRDEVLGTSQAQASLAQLASREAVIVLCFEASERCCHRSLVLDAVRQMRA